ncbi:MAG: hypothetical protein ACI4EF_04600 [Coprococcus sp.]
MNNSTKAVYAMAEKMLKGRIEVDEVVAMSGLPKEEIEKMKKELDNANPEATYLRTLDFNDFDIGPILNDETIAGDEA